MANGTTGPRTLPKRAETPADAKWRLEDIYPDDRLWETEFSHVKELLAKAPEYQGKVGESAQTLLAVAKLQDEVGERVSRLYAYARMRKDEDNANPAYQSLSGRAETLAVQARSAFAFVVPEIIAIPAVKMQEYHESEPGLAIYRHRLHDIERSKPHTLTPSEERIVAMAGEMGSAPHDAFSMLNNADIRFPVIRDEEGNEVELTKGRYVQFMESRDRRVRRDAFEAMYGTYNKQRNTLGALLTGQIKRDIYFAQVHNYPSALAASLHEDNVPPEVYSNLIAAVRERNSFMHRYVKLRRRALGLDELHMYDLYVPIVKDVDMKVPFDKAKELVAKGLAPLGQEYLTVLQQGLRSGWVDVLENQGKTSGAYSWGAFPTHPYVLLNYKETVDNMFTLAHEMGHAMHTHHTYANQPFVYSSYTTFVAEVASTLNEALLMDYMLKVTGDKNERLYLLNHYLETIRGTIYRQTMFAEFEKIIHERVEAGESLTPDELSRIYHGLNVDYYGPDVVVDPEIDMEWSRIPHFYMTFYVFQYATGMSAALALSQQILSEGQPAVDRYLRFLSSGSSQYPIDELREAGVDMASPEPVKKALDIFGKLVDEMEELMS